MTAPATISVALLNFAYWPEVRRGNERLVHDLAVELAASGTSTSILTSHRSRSTRSIEEGVSVVRHRRPPDWPLRIRRFQPNLTHVPLSYSELRRRDFDIAHAFFPSDALATTRWATKAARPCLYTFTGLLGRENVSNVRYRRRALEIATSSDAVVTISQAARDEVWRWLAVEPRVIYPGVRLEHFLPQERTEHPTIACAADPSDKRKRVDLLVRAFARLRRDRPDAELMLMRPSSDSDARELEQREGVRLFPADADSAPEMLGTAWASALCSTREAFGLVVIESLACGAPVLATRDGALPEIIDRPEIGSLFDGEDERSVAHGLAAVLELAADPATVAACRSRAEEFSAARTAAEHDNLYRELLAA